MRFIAVVLNYLLARHQPKAKWINSHKLLLALRPKP